jgi:hypothetical protein
MSEMLSTDKTKLNDFHKSQPALSKPGFVNSYPAGVELGTLIDKALSNVCSKATWDFASHGGAITPDIYLGVTIPAGAIVTGVVTREVTNVTSLGAPEFVVTVGATAVATVADATALAGVQVQTATAAYFAAESKVYLNINTAAATAGKVEFYISYICP